MIDRSRDALLSQHAIDMLRDRYMIDGEISPQEAFARACNAFADDQDHAQRLYDYVSRGWFMFATPVLANGGTKRGLPISCFLSAVPDSREGILAHYTETAWLETVGGGVGGYWGRVRSSGARTKHGSRSSGIIPFMHVVDAEMLAFSQGDTRRGSYAAYLDIQHPEIEEFLLMRKPAGGDVNRKNLNLHQGVNVPDAFMRIIEHCMRDAGANDDWPLIDPNSGAVVKVVSAKAIWQQIIETRLATGEPYLFFIDTANKHLPTSQKELGLEIHGSNLCAEIALPTGVDCFGKNRTAVCCLSSVNAEKFDEWVSNDSFIADVVRMLDNVLQAFIDAVRAKYPALEDAAYSAERERSIGLGAMGFHAYLQKKGVPFESPMAVSLNKKIFGTIKLRAFAESFVLAKERGEAPDMEGTGVRFAHLMAIAPNASSSLVLDTSPSIEPWRANAFMQKTMSGSITIKNKHLAELLEDCWYEDREGVPLDASKEAKDAWLAEQWASIVAHKGSVQHLTYLTDRERAVFKTAVEIDQNWIIQHAADRQEYVCQAQSVNLFFQPGAPLACMHAVHFAAWKHGLKSLYYMRSEAASRAEDITAQVDRAKVFAIADDTCLSCQG